MRKVVSITFTVALLFASQLVLGQGYTFRVLANKGQNTVKRAGASAAVALKTGATLNIGDELIASQGAYIGLMHKSGKTLEVRTPGPKKIADLEKKVNTKTASVSSRYAQFLANKMNEQKAPDYRRRLNATGAVSRAVGDGVPIEVLIHQTHKLVVEDKAILSWLSPPGIEDNTYIITIKTNRDQPLLKKEVSGNKLLLDFTSPQLDYKEGVYIIKIEAKENPKAYSDVAMERLTEENARYYRNYEYATIMEELAALKAEVSDDDVLGKIIYASFFEQYKLYVDALTKIEEAIEMSPEIPDFLELKKDIVERASIKVYKERDNAEEATAEEDK